MAIENLFLLCGELRERSIFFAPLLSIREQVARDRESGEPWVAVWDEGSSLPLEEAFEHALVLNQNGPELEDTWFAILAAPMEDPQLEFPAVLNALEGVVHMPESADSAGQPWIGAIVDALALFACRLEEYYSNPDARNRALTRQINRAKSSFIDWTTADSDLLRNAVHSDGPRWPGWAFRRLKLFASAESGDLALPREVWVWKYLYECIPVNFEYSKLDLQCGSDEIVKLKVSEATFNYLQSVYHLFERARLDNPFPGVGSIMVGVLRALKEVAMHYPHLETQIADVRNRLFQQVRSSTEESHPFMREVLRRSAEALDRRTVAAEEKLSPVDAELLVEAWQAYRSEGNPASGSHFLRI